MKLKRILFPLWQLLPTLLLLSAITFADDAPLQSRQTAVEAPGATSSDEKPRWSIMSRVNEGLKPILRALENVDTLLRSTRNFDVLQCMERYSCEMAAPLRSGERRSPLRSNGGIMENVDTIAQQMNDAFEEPKEEEADAKAEDEEETTEAPTKDEYKYPQIVQQFVQPMPQQQQFGFGGYPGYPGYPGFGGFPGYPAPFGYPPQYFGGANQTFMAPQYFGGFPFAFRGAQGATEEAEKTSAEKPEHSASEPHAEMSHDAETDHAPMESNHAVRAAPNHPGMSAPNHPGMSAPNHPGMSAPVHPGMPAFNHPGMPAFHHPNMLPLGHFDNPIRAGRPGQFSQIPRPPHQAQFNRRVASGPGIPNFSGAQSFPFRSATPAAAPSPVQRNDVQHEEPAGDPSFFSGYRAVVSAAQNRIRTLRGGSERRDDRNWFRRMFGLRRSRRSVPDESVATEIKRRFRKEIRDAITEALEAGGAKPRVKRGIFDTITNAVSGKEIIGALDRMMEGSDNSLYPYTRAALMGYTGDPRTCQQLYPQCPTSADQLIYTFNNLKKYFPDGVPFKDRIPRPFRYLLP